MKISFFKKLVIKYKIFEEATQINKERLRREIIAELLQKMPDSLVQFGYSVYSQNEEDGILQEIFKRLNIKKPTFIEFGVHPVENNTLFLLVNKTGRGVWIDKGLTNFATKNISQNLKIVADFITLDNIEAHVKGAIEFANTESNSLDLLSLDLDGNDYYFISKLLNTGIYPKIFCLEYNSKFPPPAEVSIPYNPNHIYKYDDYSGCSLQTWVNLMQQNNYTLVYCGISGTNAFFIQNQYLQHFKIYSAEELFQPIRNYLTPAYKGNKSTLKFLNADL